MPKKKTPSVGLGGMKEGQTPNQSITKLLRCPIRAGNPEHYASVVKHCTPDQRMKGNSRVNEHLMRYHSLRFWCIDCKTNFASAALKHIDAIKANHNCQPKEWSDEEKSTSHTWMTVEQEEEWRKWKSRSKRTRTGSAVHQHYKTIWNIFNPDSETHDLDSPSGRANTISVPSPSATLDPQVSVSPSIVWELKSNADLTDERSPALMDRPRIEVQIASSPDGISDHATIRPTVQGLGSHLDSLPIPFMDPLSADMTIDEIRRRSDAINHAVYSEATIGPDSIAFSSSSRNNELIPGLPATPLAPSSCYPKFLDLSWHEENQDLFPYAEVIDFEADGPFSFNTLGMNGINEDIQPNK